MRYRFLSLLAAFLLTIGFGPFLMAGSAYASGGTEYCAGSQCLNAWNEGPDVNVYTANVDNDAFQSLIIGILPDGTYEYGIQFEGGGTHSGDCIGDLGNNPDVARAGLYSNCITGNVGWGAIFTVDYNGCASGYFGYHNSHWGGWLAPASPGDDGAAFYLNNSVEHCFYQQNF
jgi:hypothetical protein